MQHNLPQARSFCKIPEPSSKLAQIYAVSTWSFIIWSLYFLHAKSPDSHASDISSSEIFLYNYWVNLKTGAKLRNLAPAHSHRAVAFCGLWGALSSISLLIERAPPLSISLHAICLFSYFVSVFDSIFVLIHFWICTCFAFICSGIIIIWNKRNWVWWIYSFLLLSASS